MFFDYKTKVGQGVGLVRKSGQTKPNSRQITPFRHTNLASFYI